MRGNRYQAVPISGQSGNFSRWIIGILTALVPAIMLWWCWTLLNQSGLALAEAGQTDRHVRLTADPSPDLNTSASQPLGLLTGDELKQLEELVLVSKLEPPKPVSPKPVSQKTKPDAVTDPQPRSPVVAVKIQGALLNSELPERSVILLCNANHSDWFSQGDTLASIGLPQWSFHSIRGNRVLVSDKSRLVELTGNLPLGNGTEKLGGPK